MQAEINRLAQAEAQRNWVSQNLAKFTEVLRQNYETQKEMGDQILANLIPSLGAVQGGLFLLESMSESEHYLRLVACYAYNRKKYFQKQLLVEDDFAEGLVGQVFLEEKTAYLENIPEDYLSITSGLGEAPPRYLLICPLRDNDEAIGVLEIASLKPIAPHEIEFVERLSQVLASTVIITRINERTRVLLTATREQTEELQAQDEELRQNMEELQATQEEMARLNKDLEDTLHAIDQSSLSAELNPEGHFVKANFNMLRFLGYAKAELIGQHHNATVNEAEALSEEYQRLWQNLRQGRVVSGEFPRKTKNGETRWIRGTYYPILDQQQKIKRVLKIAYDITLEKEQQMALLDKQRIIRQNEALLRERTKTIQDKAYVRIKALKAELEEKDRLIAQMQNEPSAIRTDKAS
ncbi:MAG: PAS domain S-box protein [Microscillaceae bacterium]|nr:PAS domain S-box protein [Microscillaceae bacterium]